MNKKNITKFLQSVVAMPLFAIAMPISGIIAPIPVTISQDNAIVAPLITPEEYAIRKEHAKAIDEFFASKNSPLEGYGQEFVREAEKNFIDWRLLPAIAMRESTGGLHACKSDKAPNNNFGWFSCKKGFSSVDESIEYIAMTLGGKNNNAPHYHEDMTTVQILRKYNPPSIVRNYSNQVIRIMKMIDSDEEII